MTSETTPSSPRRIRAAGVRAILAECGPGQAPAPTAGAGIDWPTVAELARLRTREREIALGLVDGALTTRDYAARLPALAPAATAGDAWAARQLLRLAEERHVQARGYLAAVDCALYETSDDSARANVADGRPPFAIPAYPY